MDEEAFSIPMDIMVQIVELERGGRFHIKPVVKECFLRKLEQAYPDEEGWADQVGNNLHIFSSTTESVTFQSTMRPSDELIEILDDPKHPEYEDASRFYIATIGFVSDTEDDGVAAMRALKECVKEKVTMAKVEKKFFEKVGEQKGLDPYMTSSYAKGMFGKSRKRKSKKAKKTRRRRRRV
jgi:hypothetical protein